MNRELSLFFIILSSSERVREDGSTVFSSKIFFLLQINCCLWNWISIYNSKHFIHHATYCDARQDQTTQSNKILTSSIIDIFFSSLKGTWPMSTATAVATTITYPTMLFFNWIQKIIYFNFDLQSNSIVLNVFPRLERKIFLEPILRFQAACFAQRHKNVLHYNMKLWFSRLAYN